MELPVASTGRPERRRTGLVTAIALATIATARLAYAAATTPTPVLSAARGATAGGARTVLVDGVFDFPNAVQSGTALYLVMFQGTRFVRYPLGGPPVTGDSPLLADGSLDPSDVPSFLATGTTAAASVRFLTLVPAQARVVLPATFTAGPATAVVFGVFEGESVFSNPLGFVLP